MDNVELQIVTPTAFTEEEKTRIHKLDLPLLEHVVRTAKEIALCNNAKSDGPLLNQDLVVDEDNEIYVLTFTYPPEIAGRTSDHTNRFIAIGAPYGTIGHQDIYTGLERFYYDSTTGVVRKYEDARYVIAVTMHFMESKVKREFKKTYYSEEVIKYIPRIAASNTTDGTMVYRRQNGTTFATTGSPRTKNRSGGNAVTSPTSPHKRIRVDGPSSASSASSVSIQPTEANRNNNSSTAQPSSTTFFEQFSFGRQ